MTYKVLALGDGKYQITQNGSNVSGARVIAVEFPSISSHKLEGEVHFISGNCVAKIKVPDVGIIENLPLEFPTRESD